MRGLLFFFIFICSSQVIGQFAFTLGTGTESVSMGRTSVTLNGPNSILGNQSLMVNEKAFSLTANAARRYNINGLDIFSIGAIYPTSLGHFGMSIQQFGFEGYKEQKIAIAYGRRIASNTSISIQADLLNLSQFEFGNKSFFSIEVGFFSKLTERVALGAHIFAPAGKDIDGEYGIPTRFRVGPRINVGDNTVLFVELEKILDLDPVVKSGLEYRMNEIFAIRMGFIPEPSEFSFGFAYSFGGKMNIDGGFLYDQRLGISPAVGLQYSSITN